MLVRSVYALLLAFSLLLWVPRLHAQPAAQPTGFDPPDTLYTTGDDVEVDRVILRSLPVAGAYRDFLPVHADLTRFMPPPGNQGRLSSCVAWATAYAARGYYGAAFEGRDPRQLSSVPSPAYVYHLSRGKECTGTNVFTAAEVLKKGAPSLAQYPYADQCSPPPDAEEIAKAHDFQVRGVTRVDKDRIDDIKGQIARSNPVIISFHDSPGWHRHRGDATFTDLTFDPDEKKNGWHAMVIVGYDDQRQAFRLQNSWGPRWGDHGYGWIDYQVLRQRIRLAAVLNVAKPSRPVAFAEPVPPLPKLSSAPPSPPKPTVTPPPPMPTRVEPAPPPAPPRPGPWARYEPLGPKPSISSVPPAIARPVQLSSLQTLSCADLATDRRGGRNVISGFVSSEADLDFVQRVAVSTPDTSLRDVAVAPWPQCEAMLTLRKPLAASGKPAIHIDSGGELRGGDLLRIEVHSPARIAYLYVSYVQADGSVVNLVQPGGLVPRPALPNTRLAFGDGLNGRQKFTVSAPFGREMIIALASGSPLFERELPTAQTEREYLSALRRAVLSSSSAPERELSAAIRLLRTRER